MPAEQTQLSRRALLRGLGVAVALPAFQSYRGATAMAAEAAPVGLTATGAPLRMAFLSIPNGVQQQHWFPIGDPAEFKLNSSMQPLEHLKPHFQVISGLDHENATAGNDGAGDHARANATFLTGARARKTSGRNILVGQSVDQFAAQRVRAATRLPSLELSCDSVRTSGSCDSGYACAYQYNLSWSTATTPMPPDPDPRSVFERLFGSGSRQERAKNYAARQQSQRSILDFVMEDAARVQRQLGGQDRSKLNEYLESVRAIEARIQSAEQLEDLPNPDMDTPSGVPATFSEHMQIMMDIVALAFETDSTRVATLLLAHDGSNRVFPEIGIAEGHHHLSHNQEKADLALKVAAIDQFYIQHLAKFLDRLANTEDVDGNSVLHNSMIVYGGAIADGNRHTHHNLPVVLAGQAGGRFVSGRFLAAGGQPMSNLYVEMLNTFGLPVKSFGDSTGRLEKITVA